MNSHEFYLCFLGKENVGQKWVSAEFINQSSFTPESTLAMSGDIVDSHDWCVCVMQLAPSG